MPERFSPAQPNYLRFVSTPTIDIEPFFIGDSFLNPMTDPKSGLFAAKGDSWFSHIAVEVPGEACKNEWCETVSDEAYEAL